MLKALGVAALVAVFAFQANSHADKAKQGKANQQPPSPIAPAGIKQPDSPSPQTKGQKHIPNDVWIVKTPDKDAFDIASLTISIVLGMVGILGVVVGIATVLYIKRQAFETGFQRIVMRRTLNTLRRQTNILAHSVAAAKKSADAALAQVDAMKNRERARVWITIDGDLNLGMGPLAIPVPYVVTQTGPTDAFVYASFAKLVISAVEPGIPQEPSIHSIGIQNRLSPQFEKKIESVFLHKFSREEVDSISAKTASAYFIASIKYKDIFGDPHETSIMKRWQITDLKNLMGYGNFAYWTPCGPPETNRET